MYPRELQLNKGNTSDRDTFFLDFNIKVINRDSYVNVLVHLGLKQTYISVLPYIDRKDKYDSRSSASI